MNTYSSGPTQAAQLKSLKEQSPSGSEQTPSTNTVKNLDKWEKNNWIDDDLKATDETTKMWSAIENSFDQNSLNVDITTSKFGGPKLKPLYKKHNGIIWKIDYDSTLQSIVLQPKDNNIKLYRASSTTGTAKAVEDKQVYFAESHIDGLPEKPMKVTVVIK